MTLKFELFDACQAVHPESGALCSQESGHTGKHCYTVWEWDAEAEENYPSHPVWWSNDDEPPCPCGESRPSLAYDAHSRMDSRGCPPSAVLRSPAGGEAGGEK